MPEKSCIEFVFLIFNNQNSFVFPDHNDQISLFAKFSQYKVFYKEENEKHL